MTVTTVIWFDVESSNATRVFSSTATCRGEKIPAKSFTSLCGDGLDGTALHSTAAERKAAAAIMYDLRYLCMGSVVWSFLGGCASERDFIGLFVYVVLGPRKIRRQAFAYLSYNFA